MTGGPAKEHGTNKTWPTRRVRERSKQDITCPITSQNPSLWHPSWLNKVCPMRKDSESEWLAKDNMETDPIIIKPETASHVAELFSWVPLPSCSPPRCPFPIKSLALSSHVSSQTIHFWVLDKSPVLGPGRSPLYCNKWRLWWGLFFAETDILTTQGTQGPACLPMAQTQQPQLGPFCPCLLLMWTTGQSALTGKEQETLLTSLPPSLFPLLSPSYPSPSS